MTQTLERPPVPVIVQQHAEESAMLRHVRSVLVRAPHVRLRHLRRLDDRIAAHLDGLVVAGRYGTALCKAALERVGAGEVFALAIRVLQERDQPGLDRLVALAGALPDAHRGLLSAFGWLSAASLQGTVQELLAASEPHRRALGIGACRLHRVDPGAVLVRALEDEALQVRIAALRTIGELGRTDLLAPVLASLEDADPSVAFHAAACASLLGDRDHALRSLESMAKAPGPWQAPARQLLLLASDFARARDFLRAFAKGGPAEPAHQRVLIAASGLLGDVRFVPWLIGFMEDDVFARVAGEAFSLLTGADLAALDLERKPPEKVPAGPTDDPDDDDVAMDADESLPWPDRARVQRWWQENAGRMPADARSFMGRPPTRELCVEVLREGFQRQRIVAAQLSCLLDPGQRLFPVCAPSWRQQRLLAG